MLSYGTSDERKSHCFTTKQLLFLHKTVCMAANYLFPGRIQLPVSTNCCVSTTKKPFFFFTESTEEMFLIIANEYRL